MSPGDIHISVQGRCDGLTLLRYQCVIRSVNDLRLARHSSGLILSTCRETVGRYNYDYCLQQKVSEMSLYSDTGNMF